MIIKSFKTIAIIGLTISFLAACQYNDTHTTAYWQRIDATSALYLTGPKAQQTLEENVSTCVREIDELLRLRALRETTPPNTHQAYHEALRQSGDLASFDTPRHFRNRMVDHSEYYDFESCMRSKGWERVRAVRYQADKSARQNYKDTTDLRTYGVTGRAAELMRQQSSYNAERRYNDLND